ncbi:universal stress protein [Halospeciosus flavus]|uniref:universal stress protein n=1 Tax=Halospeciosus flavus TaxID=3032283 RepID=UPI0036230208
MKARAAERGLDATTAVRDGDPTKVVPAYADEVDADLLVVGSHGKTPREKVQGLGSVSEAVVKSTDRAVLVVGVGSGRGADRDAGEEADEEADE